MEIYNNSKQENNKNIEFLKNIILIILFIIILISIILIIIYYKIENRIILYLDFLGTNIDNIISNIETLNSIYY